jgi:hypothetical protein
VFRAIHEPERGQRVPVRLGVVPLRTAIVVIAAGVWLGLAGCGSGASSRATDDGSPADDTCTSPDASCVLPPTLPADASATTITTAHNYAVRTLYLGDTDRAGNASPTAWQSFGYNLDGLITTAQSRDVCTRAAGAAATIQQDGFGGIDNSFGANIVPIIALGDGPLSPSVSASIEAGQFTVMAYVVGFDDGEGNTSTAAGLTGALLTGGSYGAVNDAGPTWDLTTAWPVVSSSLTCGAACPASTNPVASSTAQLAGAYQSGGALVNEAPVPVTLNLPIAGLFTVNIEATVISFRALRPGSVTEGTIAGAIETTTLVGDLWGGSALSTSLCGGSALQSVAQQLVQASDIVLDSDGTVTNGPGLPCNAISIGIGFDATEIALPTDSAIVAPPVAPCDGGY